MYYCDRCREMVDPKSEDGFIVCPVCNGYIYELENCNCCQTPLLPSDRPRIYCDKCGQVLKKGWQEFVGKVMDLSDMDSYDAQIWISENIDTF